MLGVRTRPIPARSLFVLTAICAGLAPQPLAAQWITGYYSDQNPIEGIASIPWRDYTHVNHFAAAAGVDLNGAGNGTVSINYLEPTTIPTFIAAAHTAGKLALVTIMDNPSYPNAFPQNAAPGMVAIFASNIARFVQSHGYDGVDLDWEDNIVPGEYSALLSALRDRMPNNVITAAMDPFAGLPSVAAASYSKLDQINIMCYDMDKWHGVSWYNDAIFQRGTSAIMSCDARIEPFLSVGVPSTKIGVGMPFYGRRWTGVTEALQTGWTGIYTIFYNQLVRDASRWQPQYMYYDGQYDASFLSIPVLNEFVTYTGPQQIQNMVAWAKSKNFGGFMTFAVEYEYLSDQSGDAKYPLSTALHNAVSGSAPASGSGSSSVVVSAPPTVAISAPKGVISGFGTQATLAVATDIPGVCRYGPAPGVAYSALPYGFATTGGTVHSGVLTDLASGTDYTYYVKCADAVTGVASADFPVAFSVADTGDSDPLPVAVTPASGAGSNATFTVQASDPGGFGAINQIDLIIDTPWVGQPNSCWLSYWVPSKTVYLRSDDNASWLEAQLGARRGPSNSQCAVDASAMSVSGSGNTLSVQFPVSFNAGYAGAKKLIVIVGDRHWLSSGWQTMGLWNVQ